MANSISSIVMESPNGIEEECIYLNIEDTNEPFVLHNVTTIGQEYTFSCWRWCDSAGYDFIVDVGHTRLNYPTPSGYWEKCELTFVASGTDIKFNFTGPYYVYIYHPQLELGNKATDWVAAPEDIEDSIASGDETLHKEIVKQSAQIVQDTSSIILSAVEESYVKNDDYNDFKQTLTSELETWAGGITGRVTATEENIQNVNADLQEKFNTITKYFTFDINGLLIGAVDADGKPSPYKVVIDNDEISILVNDVPIQEFKADGSALIPSLNVTRQLSVLGLQITEDDTHINCDFMGV